MWQQLTLPFPPFRSPSLLSPTSKIIVRGCLYTTYHTHTSPYVYIGRIRFMVFPPAASKATLIYIGEFLYYTFNVYDLLYIFYPSPYPYPYFCSPCPLYIYVKAATQGCLSFYLYIYDYIYTFIYIRFYVYDLRRLRGSYIGSLIIYIRYTYYIKGNLCIRSAASFLALREPRAVGFGLRP